MNPVFIVILLMVSFCSCDNKDDDGDVKKKSYTITIDPSVTYQEMIGFGGALTWYSDRIISSPRKNEICQLLFEDLGIDMVRFKNNYYPSGYPAVKTTTVMENSGLKTLFETTNQLYDLAKGYNPEILTLLSSWSPPSALKSNSALNNGTLKKESGVFMYQAFADYWSDVLDNISFSPDYISIQNEPSWVTDSWETCMWRPTETTEYPGYVTAFDMVYENISTRVSPPLMLGPEAENIGASSFGGNTFAAFSDPLKTKTSLAVYGFHTYNFNENSSLNETETLLNMIRTNYGNKPSIMTEYAGMTWFKTARFIIRVLNEANASGYLYWDMAWGPNTTAMMNIDINGNYSLSPFYYMMKHFSKNIDRGYDRVKATMTITSLEYSAFINPAGDQLTLIIINPLTIDTSVDFAVTGKTISSFSPVRSVEGNYYSDQGTLSAGEPLTLKASSITTVVIDI